MRSPRYVHQQRLEFGGIQLVLRAQHRAKLILLDLDIVIVSGIAGEGDHQHAHGGKGGIFEAERLIGRADQLDAVAQFGGRENLPAIHRFHGRHFELIAAQLGHDVDRRTFRLKKIVVQGLKVVAGHRTNAVDLQAETGSASRSASLR